MSSDVTTVPQFSRQRFVAHLMQVPAHEAHSLALDLRMVEGDDTVDIKNRADTRSAHYGNLARHCERVALYGAGVCGVGLAVMGLAVLSSLDRQAALAVCAAGGLLGLGGGLVCAAFGMRSSGHHEEADNHASISQRVQQWASYFTHADVHAPRQMDTSR